MLDDSFPVIYGADLTSPVAYRWKTQINENAKIPAFAHALPEMDHNEIVGWDEGGGAERFSAVFLDDPDQHPRARQRFELTANLIESSAAGLIQVEAEGETRTARMLWTVMLGDLVSLAPRREARRRSLARRGDREPEGRARQALASVRGVLSGDRGVRPPAAVLA